MKHRGKLITLIYEINEKCRAYEDGDRLRLSMHDDGNVTWIELGGNCIWSTESSSDPNAPIEHLTDEIYARVRDMLYEINRIQLALSEKLQQQREGA